MEQEIEEMHITAPCNALGVPFCVVYLDRSPSNDGAAANQYIRRPSPATGSVSTSEDKKSDENQRPLFTLLSGQAIMTYFIPKTEDIHESFRICYLHACQLKDQH